MRSLNKQIEPLLHKTEAGPLDHRYAVDFHFRAHEATKKESLQNLRGGVNHEKDTEICSSDDRFGLYCRVSLGHVRCGLAPYYHRTGRRRKWR